MAIKTMTLPVGTRRNNLLIYINKNMAPKFFATNYLQFSFDILYFICIEKNI